MANEVKIQVPPDVIPPTTLDIRAGKQYILNRTDAEIALKGAIDALLGHYITLIVKACYRYNIKPQDFAFSANEQLRNEVYTLLDEAEEDVFSMIEASVVPNDQRNKHYDELMAWVITLGTHNWNFHQTLRYYISRFASDVEAGVAAMRYANRNVDSAIRGLKSGLHTPYSVKEIAAAVNSRTTFASEMIRSGGTKTDPFTHLPSVGLSKSGATNITTMARSTLSMVWMRDLWMAAREQGKIGYFVLRGSTYPCPHICDLECGWFHPIEKGMVLPLHANCKCYAVFVDSNNKDKFNDFNNIL